VNGVERRAQRDIARAGLDDIPEFDYAIVATAAAAAAHGGAAEVRFHCAHGYGEFYLPAQTWLRGLRRGGQRALVRTIQERVADHHARKGIGSDRREYWKVVAL
jgi:hypothetical protein